ncbi:CASC1 family protein [Megaselia abdita]
MPPKKKLTKKEKARLEAEQAELLRLEMERERQRKLEEERERKEKERAAAVKRQQQEIKENKIRRMQLKDTMTYFGVVQSTIDQILINEKNSKNWAKYMRCNGLPNAQYPGELRKYIHMWRSDIRDRNSLERNWLLQTDERTLLTHDPDIPDLSRQTLRKHQEDLGDIYAKRTEEVLGILFELDEAIKDVEISKSIKLDLLKLKVELREYLKEYIDEFTYRILSQIDRDMEVVRPGVNKSDFASNVFKCQILTYQASALLNPNSKVREEPKHTVIEMPLLNLEVSLPPSINLGDSALRGLWLNYDHFSDYCASFHKRRLGPKKLSIYLQSKKEWKKRKEILQDTIDAIAREIPTMETLDSVREAKTADVDKVYAQYEAEIIKARRKSIGPEGLNLGEFDVNLRKYKIIGGVFSMDYLEQPHQDRRLNAKSFIRNVISSNSICQKSFHQDYKPPPPPVPGVRRLPEEIEAEMKTMEANLEKLTLFTVDLPKSVLWFEPPIVCRWEIVTESITTECQETNTTHTPVAITPVIPSSSRSNGKSLSAQTRSTISIKSMPLKDIQDFDLFNIPPQTDIYGLVMEFVVPRLPYGYTVRIENPKTKSKKVSYTNIARRNTEDECVELDKSLVKPVEENLVDTGSPRELFSQVRQRRILQITKQHPKSTNNVYLFSQLVTDLDDLYDLQRPILDDRMSEIGSNLSNSRSRSTSDSSIKSTSTRKFIILKESEVPDSNEETAEEEEESLSEYEDEEDDEDNVALDLMGEDKNEFPPKIGKWSTRDVHDSKFNEDKLCIQFRTGRLGVFGFALNRYSNMPYQTWDIKPDTKNPGVILFSLTASMVSLDVFITKDGYCVNSFQGGNTDDINSMIGKTITLEKMKSILINASIDIFPDEDAFCYTEGSCEKNYVMEMHLYNCMSTVALSHNFGWSRWNLLAGSRVAVLLMREAVEGKKMSSHSTLYVTPLFTTIIECSEVSASFNTIPVQGMDFYADLYQLLKVHADPTNIEKQKGMDAALRQNLAEILSATRPLSFC